MLEGIAERKCCIKNRAVLSSSFEASHNFNSVSAQNSKSCTHWVLRDFNGTGVKKTEAWAPQLKDKRLKFLQQQGFATTFSRRWDLILIFYHSGYSRTSRKSTPQHSPCASYTDFQTCSKCWNICSFRAKKSKQANRSVHFPHLV